MNTTTTQSPSTFTEQCLRQASIAASFMGARFFVAIPNYPIHVILTRMKANQEKMLPTVRTLYQQAGVRGFYSAFGLYATKVLLTESYRGPAMIALPKVIQSHFPASIQKWNQHAQSITAGLLASIGFAGMDAAILTPLLRLSTHQITHSQPTSAWSIGKTYFHNASLVAKGREVFKGFGASYGQFMAGWSTFFILDEWRRMHAKNPEQKSLFVQFTCSPLMAGIVTAFTNSVPDTLRVLKQKSNHSNHSVFHLMKTLGAPALFRGLTLKITARTLDFAVKSLVREHFDPVERDSPSSSVSTSTPPQWVERIRAEENAMMKMQNPFI